MNLAYPISDGWRSGGISSLFVQQYQGAHFPGGWDGYGWVSGPLFALFIDNLHSATKIARKSLSTCGKHLAYVV